jgi:hypothetical protein
MWSEVAAARRLTMTYHTLLRNSVQITSLPTVAQQCATTMTAVMQVAYACTKNVTDMDRPTKCSSVMPQRQERLEYVFAS